MFQRFPVPGKYCEVRVRVGVEKRQLMEKLLSALWSIGCVQESVKKRMRVVLGKSGWSMFDLWQLDCSGKQQLEAGDRFESELNGCHCVSSIVPWTDRSSGAQLLCVQNGTNNRWPHLSPKGLEAPMNAWKCFKTPRVRGHCWPTGAKLVVWQVLRWPRAVWFVGTRGRHLCAPSHDIQHNRNFTPTFGLVCKICIGLCDSP